MENAKPLDSAGGIPEQFRWLIDAPLFIADFRGWDRNQPFQLATG
jgi:hypothetical protein